jgi:hypothetical protein
LNLPAQLYSYGLRKLVAGESVRGSFEAAAAAVERATGVAIGKRQVEHLAQAAAGGHRGVLHRPMPGAGQAGSAAGDGSSTARAS